jgi:hypothetical protein
MPQVLSLADVTMMGAAGANRRPWRLVLNSAIYWYNPFMQLHSVADVTMTGSAVQLSTTVQLVKWFTVTGVTISSAAARLGDSAVTTTRGIPIAANGVFTSPAIATESEVYDLSQVYAIGTNNDKLSVVYGV